MTHVQYGIYSHFEYFYHPSPMGQSKEGQVDAHHTLKNDKLRKSKSSSTVGNQQMC